MHQRDEDVFQGALARLQVLEPDPRLLELLQEKKDLCIFGSIERELELVAAVLQREVPARKRLRNRGERRGEVQAELLLAELLHQRGLLLHDDQAALADDADAV